MAFVTLAEPGELRTAYLLARESPDTWRFYSLTRSAADSLLLNTGSDDSLVNRAVALYRHYTGRSTDGAPPVAP